MATQPTPASSAVITTAPAAAVQKPPVSGRPFEHSKSPKPDADSTNALVTKTVADGKGNRFQEEAPVPETHFGGLYRNARGQLVNANGISLEDDGSQDEPITLKTIVTEIGSDNPLAQRLIAKEAAKNRKAAVSVSVDDGPQSPELAEDVAERKRAGRK
jgi:hypothetical protein